MAQEKYITVAELVEAFDSRDLGDLSSDTGTPATVDESNAKILNAIERASADVESYALRGQRYSLTDLSDMKADDDWTLKGLVAALAMKKMYARRGGVMPDAIRDAANEATQSLTDLVEGKQVFSNAGAQAAGRPSIHILSSHERGWLGLASDQDFFPQRQTQEV